MSHFRRRDDFLPFSKPTIRQQEIDEVVDSLRSGWITTGPKTERFERDLASYIGVPHALALSSATAGLHIGLMALGLKPGDEVITTPLTWVATTNMIELLGATPIFVDIHRDTMQIDERQIEAAITARTVGILPVHFGGAPANLAVIRDIARRHGLWVFEDAAHGIGMHHAGKHVGTESELSVFSFHPIKNVTTIEGGVLTLHDDEMARKLRALRFHGLEKSAWNRYAEGGSPQIEVVMPGFKYNFTDIQAALGIHQLASVEEFNAKRVALAHRYDELFAEIPEIGRPGVPDYDHLHTWHLYVVRVLDSAGMSRDTFMAELKKRNVGSGIHFRAVHTQPYYAQTYPQWLGKLTEAEWISDRICSLPLFPLMEEEDVRYVVDAIKDVLAHARVAA
jgi:dTDP-4-amino-4,6-dideoxygalactose transaminase